MTNNATIAVGMSGGLDSSIVVRRLLEEGCNVIGLTMRFWDRTIPLTKENAVCNGCFGPKEDENLAAAIAVAKKLGIEHHVIDLTKEFRKYVLTPFIDSNLAGETPNPCALCNPMMKFHALWEATESKGIKFDLFATGHYAKTVCDANGQYHLLRGADSNKDQSYFLSRLTQAQLKRTVFPLGDVKKTDVRTEAINEGYSELTERKESQDFFQGEDVSILYPRGSIRSGIIYDTTGKKLGFHRGLIYYTVGQSYGLGVATGRKMYITEIRKSDNAIIIGDREDVMSHECLIHDMNWISGTGVNEGTRVMARLRYRHSGSIATVSYRDGNNILLKFEEPQFAITSGQLAVLYDDGECLGGGWITQKD